MKRLFDAVVASVGLVLVLPIFGLVAIGLKLTSPGPVFFRQDRMGLGGKKFCIFKFRTMTTQNSPNACMVTAGSDPRITAFGRFLRKTKFDELPQLLNVVRGEMSLVGPRPEVIEFFDLFHDEYLRILKVRPGITHPATLKFRREEEILASDSSPREFYVNTVLPEKLAAYESDLEQSLAHDIWTIVETLVPFLGTTTAFGPDHFVASEASAVPFVPTLVENVPAFSHESDNAAAAATRAQEA